MIWISTAAAAELLTKHNGREITSAYVRTLASKGLVESKTTDDGKNLLVKRAEFEGRVVYTRAGQRVANRARDQRSVRPGARLRKKQAEGE